MNKHIIKEKKMAVQEAINEIKPLLIDLAEKIHGHPETKFEEYKASQWLSEATRKAGFKIESPLAGLETAFRATWSGSDEEGPTVAFLAEYDALPKIGHACGHNLIGTASLGAALGVARGMENVPGTIQLIGTPGEEGGGGKVVLVNAGVFDEVDAAMMFHPSDHTVLWKRSLARRKLYVEFFGKSSHAAAHPEEGVNALDATIQTFNSINALREHITEDARIHGIIIDGGEAPNIVPEHSSSLFYIRALNDDYCDQLLEKVKNCAYGAARATGARVNLDLEHGGYPGAYKSLQTNMTFAKAFKRNLEALGWEFDKINPEENIGSTDLGDVSHVVPAIHPYLSIGPNNPPAHTTEFAKAAISTSGKEAMLIAAKALASTAVDVFLCPDLLEEMKIEFLKG